MTFGVGRPANRTPQLLICGHGAIDDPDASIIFDETMQLLERPEYASYSNDIVVMRIGPSDQSTHPSILASITTNRIPFSAERAPDERHGRPPALPP